MYCPEYIKLPITNDDAYYNGVRRVGGGGSVPASRSRCEVLAALSARLSNLLASRNEEFDQVRSYSDLYNSWSRGVYSSTEESRTIQNVDDEGRRVWNVFRKIAFVSSDGTIVLRAWATGHILKMVLDEVCRDILKQLRIPEVQSDSVPSKESVQGDATQSAERDSNTIVTRDQSTTESRTAEGVAPFVREVASSEPTQTFQQLVGRWMPMKTISVDVNKTMGELLKTYYLPEDILTGEAKCAPNTIPFESFVYGQYHFTLKFVVNANKFHCGKVVVSVKFDSYQADEVNLGFQSHLTRRHLILDLSANNEGTIDIPFRYHRAFVRNLPHTTASKGVRPGKYATVYVAILSPLRTGAGGANDMDIRPFYLLREAHFAGMSYKVAVTQMDEVGDLVKALPGSALKGILAGVERSLSQLGKSINQDKPTQNSATIVIPRPRLHFPHGKGISDAVPLRLNPTALTSFDHINAYSDEPRTTLDIARIWGLRSTFVWSASHTEGKELFNSIIDPCCRSYKSDYVGQPTPLEYVCGFYQFWAGTIELRIDFVSNSFHTGAVIISAEFNRTSVETDECQSHSTYTKTFHLGEQKSVDFRIPYIYDTVVRRSTTLPYTPTFGNTPNRDTKEAKANAIGLRPESRMRVKIRVLNALRPVSTAPQDIDVLVFMRASRNFALHGLKQMSFEYPDDPVVLDSFPRDGYEDILARRRREADDGSDGHDEVARPSMEKSHRYLPPSVRNMWNERRSMADTRVYTQMDTGSKEDEDPTDNFNVGRNAMGVQSVDSQVGIKDILRRPVLLFNSVLTSSDYTGFFVPIMPPSRMWRNKEGEGAAVFTNLVASTPQAALMNLFRFWRGSMRYTIIIHGVVNTPVYVTHVPHSGVRLYSNTKIADKEASTSTPIFGSGLSSEIIIPSVNPTACVEVPFDTENSWALTFDEDSQRNYSWRDKGDTVTGHLVITALEEIKFSVFWAAGDDFEVANFYGIPPMKNVQWGTLYTDDNARVQMDVDPGGSDFSLPNVSTTVDALWDGVKRVSNTITADRLVDTAICAVPYVGPAYAASKVVGGVESTLKTVQTSADRLVSVFGTSMESLTTMINATVEKALSGLSVAGNVASMIYDIILDIVIAWADASWTAVGVGIIRFLSKVVGIQAASSLMRYATDFGQAVSELVRPEVAVVQSPPSTTSPTSTLVGILAGIVGTMMGVSINRVRYASYTFGLLDRLTSSAGVSYLCGVLRFVQSTFDLIKNMVMEGLGYVSPEARAIRMLTEASPILEKFVTDAQIVLSESNAVMVHHPGFRLRFWRTVVSAYQIQRILSLVPSNHASPVLNRLCCDVIKAGNEKFVDVSASPVRYEPFVLCIEGPPGIGKSEITENLVERMLLGIGLESKGTENVYYRMPGSRFWSGFRDQRAVVFDDWANLTDPVCMAQQLGEIYQLKSTAIFVPEMAHLEEKKIRGNPLIVVLVCNNAFPRNSVSAAVHTPEAVYRRRDLVLRAAKKEEFLNVHPRNMTAEQQATFAHLEFQKYKSPADKNSLLHTKCGYEDTANYIVASFRKWHTQEKMKVQRRLEKIQGVIGNADSSRIRLEDPFELFYSVNNTIANDPSTSQNAFLPSELLENEINRITQAVELYQRNEVLEDIPPEPVCPFDIPQSQMDWGSFGVILAGLGTARAVMAKISEVSYTVLSKWVEVLMPLNDSMGCPVCLEEAEIHYRCANGHGVCRRCVDGAETCSAPMDACPVCRSDNFTVWTDEQKIATLVFYHRWALKTGLVARDIAAGCLRLYGGTFGSCISIVTRVAMVCAMKIAGVDMDHLRQFNAAGSFLDWIEIWTTTFAALWEVETPGMDFLGSPAEAPRLVAMRSLRVGQAMAQVDCFGDDETPSTSQEAVDDPMDVFEPVVDEGRLRHLHENRVTTPLCLHAFLIGKAHQAVFKDGHFKILVGLKTVDVPEKFCTECKFNSLAMISAWYQEFCRFHRPSLINHMMGFAQTNLQQKFHLDSVPWALRPGWMYIDEDVHSELVVVSSRTTWWDYVPSSLGGFVALIGALSGVSVAIYGLVNIWGLFQTPNVPRLQNRDYDENRTRHIRQTVRSLQRPQGRSYFQAASETPALEDVVKKYVAGNYITIELSKEGCTRKLLNGVGIYNRVALLPRHYVSYIENLVSEGYTCRLGQSILPHTMHEYTYSARDFVVSPVTDLALFYLPASAGFFKDIRKFFATDDDMTHSINSSACILVPPGTRNLVLKEFAIHISDVRATQQIMNVDGSPMEITDVISYDFSLPGACGSLIMLERSQRPIVAMHVAGLSGGITSDGFGVVLTRESISSAQERPVAQMEDFEGESIEDAKMIIDTNVVYLGSLPPDQQVFIPRKTKIRPSLIQGKNGLSPLTEPCILDKTDPRYVHDETPLSAGVRKHGKLTVDFPTHVLDEVQEVMWDMYFSHLKPAVVAPRRLTPEEACVGIPGVEYYDPIILNTSAGFPYVCGGEKSKGDYVKFDRDVNDRPVQATIDDKVWATMRRKEILRKNGIIPVTPFIDTLKDERKRPEKVRKLGGTRVFCNPPLDFVIQCRQNYLHLCAASMKNRFTQGHAVGINVAGSEWTMLANRLLKISNNICTLDYSNFGPGFNAGVAERVLQLFNRWLKTNVEGVDGTELEAMAYELVYSTHICANTVYHQKAGSPSGAPITTIINSYVNLFYISCAWLMMFNSEVSEDCTIWEEFRKNVCVFVYGDDLIMAISDEIKDKFNAQTISAFFAQFNIVATDSTKSENITPYDTLENSSFLKHSFQHHEVFAGVWQSALDWTSVQDCTQWVWECVDYKMATYENCKMAIMLAHGHGRHKFEEFKDRVNKALARVGCNTIVLSWDEIDRMSYPDLYGV